MKMKDERRRMVTRIRCILFVSLPPTTGHCEQYAGNSNQGATTVTAAFPIWHKPSRPLTRRGFTLIELLVVIGVILVLVGIATVAFSRMDQSGKVTRTNLENLKGMLAELEAVTGSAEVERVNNLPNADYTLEIMRAMRRVPANQAAIERMGPKALRGGTDPPTINDGWGNRIEYIRPAGLNTVVNGTNVTIRSPDGRPFFASAGPDGDMNKGDDNVYSFD